jgi:hypothetical protein
MPVEDYVPTWLVLNWEDDITRERLLELRIQQLERLPEDQEIALERLKAARLHNKERFDKTHRLRSKSINVGDWVLVFDSSLEHQHSTLKKIARKWFGPYVVIDVHDNGTYSLRELDGTRLKVPVAGKRVKAFRRRDSRFTPNDLAEVVEFDLDEQEDLKAYESDEDI